MGENKNLKSRGHYEQAATWCLSRGVDCRPSQGCRWVHCQLPSLRVGSQAWETAIRCKRGAAHIQQLASSTRGMLLGAEDA